MLTSPPGRLQRVGAVDALGVSTVSDRAHRRAYEVDLVALKAGSIVAVGETKLRALGRDDLQRLLHVRELLHAPTAVIVLASATGVELPPDAPREVVKIGPEDIYR